VVVSPNVLTDLTQVRDRLRAFEDRYSATAQPLPWKFTTTTDLDDLLARPGPTDTHSPTDRKSSPSTWQRDQPSKDFRARLSARRRTICRRSMR
jgi:hypothetical protein